jgi:serine/threonine-protein kinase RsbW
MSMTSSGCIWQDKRVIPSDFAVGREVVQEVVDRLTAQNWVQRDVFSVYLALEEAMVNAIKHGNCCDSKKQVRFECRMFADRIWLQVSDEGTGFDPQCVPDCTAPENLDAPGGRGIMLMKSFMSRVEYNEEGNRVTMEKHRGAAESDASAACDGQHDRD